MIPAGHGGTWRQVAPQSRYEAGKGSIVQCAGVLAPKHPGDCKGFGYLRKVSYRNSSEMWIQALPN